MRKVCLVMVGVCLLAGNAWSMSFGLDDNPSFVGLMGLGAEDPYRVGRAPGAGLAPSPSMLMIGAFDGDILMPGPGIPAIQLFTPNGMFVNALSANTPATDQDIRLDFSVDRLSLGLPGTSVSGQAGLFQQPGDIFTSTAVFTSPGAFAGGGLGGILPTAGVGGGNVLTVDESALTLTASIVPGTLIGPAVPGAPFGVATHDNVDSFEWSVLDADGDLRNDGWMYFSVNPDEAMMVGLSSADIFDVAPGASANPAVPFAPAPSMGLDTFGGPASDDIDALVMWDRNRLGGPAFGGPGAEPGIDYALFSLSTGSATLGALGLSESDIFFTDFTGLFGVYAFGSDIGLDDHGFHSQWGDNVDALEVTAIDDGVVIPEPLTVLGMLMGVSGLAGYIRKRSATASK